MCKAPLGIEAQTINYEIGDWNYEFRLSQTDDNNTVVSFYSTEPAGVDFRVRYCCPQGSLVPKKRSISQVFNERKSTTNAWPWVIYFYLKLSYFLLIIIRYLDGLFK